MCLARLSSPFVPLLFVQHSDATLHDCLGHEETRLPLERPHECCRFASVDETVGVCDGNYTERAVNIDAVLNG